MKKLLREIVILIIVIFAISFMAIANDNKDIIVNVNNKPVIFDVQPKIIENRTMVPLRAIFEALGSKVIWQADTKTIYATKGSTIIILQIDNKIAFVNNNQVQLDVSPLIIEERTLVPTRFIAEALGAEVKWDGDNNMVIINTNEYKTITPEELKQIIDNKDILLIDVRTAEEYNTEHIKNSINIPNTELKDKISKLTSDKNTKIIIYCRSGARSKASAMELINMGYTNVFDLGGIINWQYETVK